MTEPKNERDLFKIIESVNAVDKQLLSHAQNRLDNLLKPPKSLGKLEEIAARLFAIRKGDTSPLSKRRVIVFCADNGVIAEGIASAPQDTTAFMTENFTKGITGVCVLAKAYWTDVKVVDVGVITDIDNIAVDNRKLMRGTRNFATTRAMDKDIAIQAVITGFMCAGEAKRSGYQLLGLGEMGIGNTTTSSAVLSALTGLSASQTTGRGAGLSDEGLHKKIDIIDTAIKKYALHNAGPLEIITAVGGLDIAAMVGAFIGAAYYGLPVVVDGFISIVAALAAYRLCPYLRDYLFLSHLSCEKGYKAAALELGMEPCLDLNLRLGEGSGCPVMFSIMDGALAVYNNMGTFSAGRISREYISKVQETGSFEVSS